MATSPFSSPTVGSDNPLSSEYLALERQKKIADLLMQKGQEQPQGQMVSGHYVAPSWAQQINPLVNSYVGSNLASQNEAKTADLAKLLRGQGVDEINKFNDLLQTDPQKAYQFAATATNPTLQKAGFENMLPKEFNLGAEETRYRTGPNGIVQEIATGKGKVEKPPTDIEIALTLNRDLPRDYRTWTQADANAAKQTIVEYKQSQRPVTNVVNNIPAGEKQYDKTFGEEVAKQDIALKATAENAPITLSNIKRQQDLLEKGGVITGVGANQRLDIARLGQALGLTGKNVVADTQQFYAGRAGSVLDSIKTSGLGAGNGFTNKDLEFLEKAKLGGIVFDAESLRRQLKIEDNVTRAIVGRYNQRVKDMPIAGGLKLNPVNVEGGVTYLGPVK